MEKEKDEEGSNEPLEKKSESESEQIDDERATKNSNSDSDHIDDEDVAKKSKSDSEQIDDEPAAKKSKSDSKQTDDEPVAKKSKFDSEQVEDESTTVKKRSPDLAKFWKAVEDDPKDFTGWTYLLQFVDTTGDIEDGREAYNAFLFRYPYCYGYWKKYADLEKRKGMNEKFSGKNHTCNLRRCRIWGGIAVESGE